MPAVLESSPKGLEGRRRHPVVDLLRVGEEGRLIYRGYDIHDLADHSTFERRRTCCCGATCPRATSSRRWSAS